MDLFIDKKYVDIFKDSELSTIVNKYNNDFGGVYYWEYNYAKPTPLQWLQNIEYYLHLKMWLLMIYIQSVI